MTQRNPMNERYQSDEKTGKTRKSAASAKPATKAAASVYREGSAPKPTGRMAKARAQANKQARSGNKEEKANSPKSKAEYYDPGTPEYKRWRRYWWVSIIIALVFTAISFITLRVLPDNYTLSYVFLGIGYAALIAGIYIDLAKVRKIRKEFREKMTSQNSKKAVAERKAAKAEEKKRAEQAEIEAAQKAAAKEAKKGSLMGRFGFGKKESGDASAVDGAKAAEAESAETKDAEK